MPCTYFRRGYSRGNSKCKGSEARTFAFVRNKKGGCCSWSIIKKRTIEDDVREVIRWVITYTSLKAIEVILILL